MHITPTTTTPCFCFFPSTSLNLITSLITGTGTGTSIFLLSFCKNLVYKCEFTFPFLFFPFPPLSNSYVEDSLMLFIYLLNKGRFLCYIFIFLMFYIIGPRETMKYSSLFIDLILHLLYCLIIYVKKLSMDSLINFFLQFEDIISSYKES